MSNSSGVEINGTDEILRNIEKLGLNVKKVTNTALKNAGEIVRKELEKITPYDLKDDDGIHMKDHVVMSNAKTDAEHGGRYVTIGYPKGIKHRVHFAEFGTINQSPQAFISKTIQSTKSKVKQEIIKELKGAIK
ncbi:HK97-gp10 family putative phage morphogenesis protein [Macrococcoides goetzii]|uniref:HK97-gp10 family putative phage morphogenesis protein n=1 Tax=Macrococcus sp. PK TaxID=2801919 RepID=UPI001F0FF621|nr:HK97-gp10 family putative phage morphogenesis protein [Macrococcus sp. PK]MCH4984219.1 HK97 gp10 family phage protein [Macrococcus sp. PK]